MFNIEHRILILDSGWIEQVAVGREAKLKRILVGHQKRCRGSWGRRIVVFHLTGDRIVDHIGKNVTMVAYVNSNPMNVRDQVSFEWRNLFLGVPDEVRKVSTWT